MGTACASPRARDAPDPPRGDLIQAGPLLVAGGDDRLRPGRRPRGLLAPVPGSSTPTSPTAATRARRSGSVRRDVIAVACDGRRSGVDAGLSMSELAAVMVELGAESAINLDGGGSTTLVHRGHLLNRPYSSQDQPAPQSRRSSARSRSSRRDAARRLMGPRAAGRRRADRRSCSPSSRTARSSDADGFADRTEQTLQSDAVSAELARRLTDGAMRAQPDLIAVRPLVNSAAEGVVRSAAFRSLVRAAARDVHRSVFDRDATTVTLTIVDAGVLLNEALNHLRPDLARRVPQSLQVTLSGAAERATARHARRGRARAPARGVRAGRGAPARRRARCSSRPRDATRVVRVGVAVAVRRRPRRARGDLRACRADRERRPRGRCCGRGWTRSRCGAGRWRARASSWAWRRRRCCGRSSSVPLLARGRAAILHTPDRPGPRAARAVAAIALGLLAILDPLTVLEVLVASAGLLLVVAGTSELLRLVGGPDAPRARVRRGVPRAVRIGRAGGRADRRPGGHRVRRRRRPRADPGRPLQRRGRAVRPPARTRSPSSAPTTRWRPTASPAGCSPPRTRASTRSCARACARC